MAKQSRLLYASVHTVCVRTICGHPSDFSMSAGGDWSMFNALSTWPRRDRASLYGSNDVAAGRPDLLRMVAGYLCQPIYIVQVCIK